MAVSRSSIWRSKNLERANAAQRARYAKNKDPILKSNEEWRARNVEYLVWHRAKQRARYKNLEFNLEIEDIKIPAICPLLDIPIIHADGEHSPALDRYDNSKGYVKGNVWVISHLANRMKTNATFEQLNTFCNNWMINHRPDMDDRWKGL